MKIEAKGLLGISVAAIDTQSKIAEVKQILVLPENGSLLGFIVKTSGLFGAKKFLSAIDIRDWDKKGIVTESFDNLIDPNEVVRAKEALSSGFELFGLKAKTESGKSLGNVEDFLIDTETNSVIKFYLKDLMLKSRVLGAEKVIKIEKKVIIFQDDVEIPTGAAGAIV